MNSQPPKNLATAVTKSMMFRMFVRIFENEFSVPLYIESQHRRKIIRTLGTESDFCVGLNGVNGNCTQCSCRVMPPPQTLMPWTWSAPCRAAMQVTMVPLTGWGNAIAWLVTGHYHIGDPANHPAEMPQAVERTIGLESEWKKLEHLKHLFSKTISMPRARHDQMVRYLETCCALIAADLNRLLTNVFQETQRSQRGMATAREKRKISCFGMEIESDEIEIRQRLEMVRKRFLRTDGSKAEMMRAAADLGWADVDSFERDFQVFFGESPFQHWKRITGLWRTFSTILGAAEPQLTETHSVA